MYTSRITTLGLATLSLTLAVCGLAAARAQHKEAVPEPKCKITPVDAIRIAKARVAGRALNANFEFDEGKWVYGVMIVSGKKIYEIEIDPITGKVADSETVTPDGEANELKSELSKAIGGSTKSAAKETEKGEKE